MVKRFSQIKLSSVGSKNVFDSNTFKLEIILTRSKIVKQKGYQLSEMLFLK